MAFQVILYHFDYLKPFSTTYVVMIERSDHFHPFSLVCGHFWLNWGSFWDIEQVPKTHRSRIALLIEHICRGRFVWNGYSHRQDAAIVFDAAAAVDVGAREVAVLESMQALEWMQVLEWMPTLGVDGVMEVLEWMQVLELPRNSSGQ